MPGLSDDCKSDRSFLSVVEHEQICTGCRVTRYAMHTANVCSRGENFKLFKKKLKQERNATKMKIHTCIILLLLHTI